MSKKPKPEVDKLHYLRAAIRRMEGMIEEEEKAQTEYEDLANMLDLAGSHAVNREIRHISQAEQAHRFRLKQLVEILVQGVHHLELQKQSTRQARARKIEFKHGRWQFDQAMENASWDEETFDWMLAETVKDLDAAEKNEFWKQHNEWKRLSS